MNELWEIEIDLLEKLKDVCKRNGLTYAAAAGTLLGAARHKGFIPWDDDIDVTLMWPDYKKLLELASTEFQYPYILQCLYNERDAMPSACRLRRSDTTGFTLWEHNNCQPSYDRGIFIDIFPLFNVPDSTVLRKKQYNDVIFYWEAVHGYNAITQRKRGGFVNQAYESYIPTFQAYCEMQGTHDIDIVKLKEKYYDVCAMVKSRTSQIGATSSKCHYEPFMYNTEWFDEYIELPFENTTICCPKEYEKVLEKQYGDWRTPVRGTAKHTMVAVDPHTPWREFDMTRLDAEV